LDILALRVKLVSPFGTGVGPILVAGAEMPVLTGVIQCVAVFMLYVLAVSYVSFTFTD
jgi:hypothetical protein